MVWLSLFLLCLVKWFGGYAVGRVLTGRTVNPDTLKDHALFAFPLGIFVIGWLEFCLSEFAGIPITSTLLYLLSIPLASAGIYLLWQDTRRVGRDHPVEVSPWSRIAWIELGVIIILFTRQILDSITEPYLGLDALRYHFPFAHVIYQTHSLPQFTSPSMGDLFFTNPPLPFMWYANVWLWLGQIHLFLPILTTVILSGHICILIYRMALRILGVTPSTALAILLCLLLPGLFSNVLQILRSTTDIPFAFWGIATAYWWLRDGVEGSDRSWVWVALCGGMMAWIKPYGYLLGVAYVGLMVLWWWRYHQEQTWTYSLSTIGKLLGLWGLFVLPLPLQHWLLWDNPLYPVFSQLFGGMLITDWSMRHNLMMLDIFSWDGYNIIIQVFSEPIVALGCFAILHPEVRKNPILRLLWIIPISYIVLYLIMFGSTISNLIPGAHARYLMPGIMLFSLFICCFFDKRFHTPGHGQKSMLIGALGLQAVLILYPTLSDGGILRQISGMDNKLYILLIEWLALFLVIGFLVTGWFEKHVVNLRLTILGIGCIFLTYAWPLAAPWKLITQPLASPFINWNEQYIVSPHGLWLHANVPPNAVLLVNDDRRWLLPRQILPADSPLLERIYAPNIPFPDKLARLAELGVTHVATGDSQGQPAPLSTTWLAGQPAWAFLTPEHTAYFTQIYSGPPTSYEQDPVGFTREATYIFRINYPPELQQIVEAPIDRPWLYEYATNGYMGRE